MSTSGFDKMLEAVKSFPLQPAQCSAEFASESLEIFQNIHRLVCCGMGGSAFPMEIVRAHIDCPVKIHRDYGDTLKVDDEGTLYLLLSFSGNTEEVLDCAERLIASEAQILVITNGGRLALLAEKHNLPKLGFPPLPADFQPRCATGYFLGLVFGVTDRLGLTNGASRLLTEACAWLQTEQRNLQHRARKLCDTLGRDDVFLIAYPPYSETVGQIGRIKLNENAKKLVHVGALPKFNHNQMEAALAVEGDVGVVLLCSSEAFERKTVRLATTGRLFERFGAAVEMVTLKGDSELAATLYGLWLLDFASLFLAELNDLDPMSIESIERFKLELKRAGGSS